MAKHKADILCHSAEVAVMVQGVVVLVPGTHQTTRSNRTVENEFVVDILWDAI